MKVVISLRKIRIGGCTKSFPITTNSTCNDETKRRRTNEGENLILARLRKRLIYRKHIRMCLTMWKGGDVKIGKASKERISSERLKSFCRSKCFLRLDFVVKNAEKDSHMNGLFGEMDTESAVLEL